MYLLLIYSKEGLIKMSTGKREIQIKIADFNYLTYRIACCKYDILQYECFFDKCQILKYIIKYKIESILMERELKKLSRMYNISIDKYVKSTFDYGRNKSFVHIGYKIRNKSG